MTFEDWLRKEGYSELTLTRGYIQVGTREGAHNVLVKAKAAGVHEDLEIFIEPKVGYYKYRVRAKLFDTKTFEGWAKSQGFTWKDGGIYRLYEHNAHTTLSEVSRAGFKAKVIPSPSSRGEWLIVESTPEVAVEEIEDLTDLATREEQNMPTIRLTINKFENPNNLVGKTMIGRDGRQYPVGTVISRNNRYEVYSLGGSLIGSYHGDDTIDIHTNDFPHPDQETIKLEIEIPKTVLRSVIRAGQSSPRTPNDLEMAGILVANAGVKKFDVTQPATAADRAIAALS
jgi:hypothetical protein